MKRLRAVLVRALLALGWLSLIVAAALFVLEQTGLAQRFVLELVAARLGVLGRSLSVEAIDVRWLEPGVELRGLRIADRRELLAVERLHVALRLGAGGGVGLARLDLGRGRILLGPSLTNGLRGIVDIEPADDGAGGPLALPEVQLRELELFLEPAEGEPFLLGRLDLAVDGGAGAPLARGRLVLPRATGSARASAIDLVGGREELERLELRASAAELQLADLAQLELPLFRALRAAELGGSVALDGALRLEPAGFAPLSGRVRLAARDASLAPVEGQPPVRDVALDLDARYAPGAGEGLWSAEAWRGAARFAASWEGLALRGSARLGAAARPGSVFEAWVRIPELELGPELVELVGAPPFLANPYAATQPEGRFDLGFGIRCARGWEPSQPIDPFLEYTATVHNATPLATAWRGIPPREGERRAGFPLPVTAEQLEVVYARSLRQPRKEQLGVEVRGVQAAGPVAVSYASWSVPRELERTARRTTEEELRIRSPRVAVDAELARAARALESAPAVAQALETYAPHDGHASVDLRLTDRARLSGMAARVEVELTGARARWTELPLAARELDGRVRYVADGRGTEVVALDLDGTLPSARGVTLRGRLRDDGEGPALEAFDVEARALELVGEDRDVIAARFPGIGEALRRFGAAGAVDLRFQRARPAAGAETQTRLDVTPRADVVLKPADLPIEVREVFGRVLTVGRERPGLDGEEPVSEWVTSVAPLVGRWPGDARVAMDARFPDGEPARARVLGAGVRPQEPEIRARLLGAEGPAQGVAGAEELALSGAIDFESALAPDAEGSAADRHLVRLRRNDFRGPGGLAIEQLEGLLVVDAEGPSSPALAGRLQDVAFELKDARLTLEPGAPRVVATVSARDVSLDRELLGLFLDERTLDGLIDELGWRGRIDVPGWRLEWSGSQERGTRVSIRGPFTVTDVRLEIGVPLSIGSAFGEIHELVIEEGTVRALGELTDLYGELMGRELGPARVLASHYGTRVSVDVLEGSFVRGRIGGLDQGLEGEEPHLRPAPAFSIELVPPFPFQLALELDGVDVAKFLEGVFAGSLSDKGRLSAELRLFGDIDDVLSIRGAGRAELRDARLWSIPVFRDLFSQLGIEETAIFDAMSTRFSLESGVVQMRDVEVRSPLLRLAGHGTLDLDGTLNHDFEVRYSVVDKLGVLRQLVYAVQNALLSVSIRGDMSRPVVILRSALTALFQPLRDEYKSLPLPEYSSLPARF